MPVLIAFVEPGSHVVRFPPGEWDGVTYVFLIDYFADINSTNASSLSHELVLPIWKSNVSLSLMVDKKAKRYQSIVISVTWLLLIIFIVQ